MQFKPGDKVECIEDFGEYKQNIGEVYTIKSVGRDGSLVLEESYRVSNPNRFKLVQDKQEKGERKQGDIVQVKNSDRQYFSEDPREFMCMYNGKFLCRYGKHGIYEYDQIRSIKPKPTLQSKLQELKYYLSTKTSIRYDRIKEYVRELETLLPAQ